MALTVLTAINRALGRLAEAGTPIAYSADLQVLIPDALRKFAEVTAQGPNAQLLRKDFSVTISSGIGSLTTALTASEPLMEQFLPSAYVVTSGGIQLHYLPDRTQLGLNRPTMIPYWCNDQGTIRTRNVIDGSLASMSTTLTITGQYVPAIESVPTQTQETFLDILALAIKARGEVPSAEAA